MPENKLVEIPEGEVQDIKNYLQVIVDSLFYHDLKNDQYTLKSSIDDIRIKHTINEIYGIMLHLNGHIDFLDPR